MFGLRLVNLLTVVSGAVGHELNNGRHSLIIKEFFLNSSMYMTQRDGRVWQTDCNENASGRQRQKHIEKLSGTQDNTSSVYPKGYSSP